MTGRLLPSACRLLLPLALSGNPVLFIAPSGATDLGIGVRNMDQTDTVYSLLLEVERSTVKLKCGADGQVLNHSISVHALDLQRVTLPINTVHPATSLGSLHTFPTSGGTDQMDYIFLLHGLIGIKFNIDALDVELGELITEHGGVLTDQVDNPHFVVGTRERVTVLLPSTQVIRREWITDSIRNAKMMPIYTYLDGSDRHPLRNLSQRYRDLAELFKAMAWSLEDPTFDILHRKFPHKTPNEWRELSRTSRDAILQAAPQISPKIEDYANNLVLQIFSLPIPLPFAPQANVGMREEEKAPHVPETEGYEGQTQRVDTQVIGEADTSVSDPQEAAGRASEDSDTVHAPVDSVNSSGDEESEDDEDRESEHADSGQTSSLEVPTLKQARRRAVPFTPADHDAMVRFVGGLDHNPVKADWETFMNSTEENKKRNAGAWRRQYSKKRREIHAEIRRLRTQGPLDSSS